MITSLPEPGAASLRMTEAAAIRIGLTVLFPMSRRDRLPEAGTLGSILANSLRQVAGEVAGAVLGPEGVQVAGYDRASDSIFHMPPEWSGDCEAGMSPGRGWETMEAFLSRFARQARQARQARPPYHGNAIVLLFVSGAYLLRDHQRLQQLLVRACRSGLSCAGSSDGSLHAVALALHEHSAARDRLRPLLGRLVSPVLPPAARTESSPSQGEWEPIENSGPMRSPALIGVGPLTTIRRADAPAYLNAALAEAILHPARLEPISNYSDGLRLALFAQREVSATRWIFNALLNIVEYRAGQSQPDSVPPEIHIATSGVCNIECRFCSYSHEMARKLQVSVAQLMRLDWLHDVHTLRLHSGNGEPTVNRSLPALIDYVGHAFPQIAMNFFTNGVLLDRAGLIQALVGSQVGWISVSLNAARPATWQKLCGGDRFERITSNLSAILEAKRQRRSATPVVYGTMVLTRDTVHELPLMPEICRRFGIDRFTAIPFFALGYDRADRLGASDAYHHVGAAYEAIYSKTVTQAERWTVSIELPAPQDSKSASFGLEARAFHDYADAEPHDLAWWKLLASVPQTADSSPLCPYLWCQAAIGICETTQARTPDGHFLYPCLGPLATANFAPQTLFHFPNRSGFMKIWRNRVFTSLREGQRNPGWEPLCDVCRGCDTRAPDSLQPMEAMLDEFVKRHDLVWI